MIRQSRERRPQCHQGNEAGIVRRRLGRPGAEPKRIARARHELTKGFGIGKVAPMTGLGTVPPQAQARNGGPIAT